MRKRTKAENVAITVALVVVFLVFAAPQFAQNFLSQEITHQNRTTPLSDGKLVVQDLKIGTGEEATLGSVVSLHYVGKFTNGNVFDTSLGGAPLQFEIGAGGVIPGFDLGVRGMKVGGSRIIVIPPELGYGENGIGPIPPNSTLFFEVELQSVTLPVENS